MEIEKLIEQLAANQPTISNLFSAVSDKQAQWKPYPEHWSLIEIISHLLDEEKEDFRARIRYTIEQKDPHSINPAAWVTERNYAAKNFKETIDEWVNERHNSIEYLRSLDASVWKITYKHSGGEIERSTRFYLENWLAHDFLHIRQATKLRYLYLQSNAVNPTGYAGNWVL